MSQRHRTPHNQKPRLRRPGITVLVGRFLAPFIEVGLLCAAAGTFDWPRAWFFFALSFIGVFGQILPVAILNPELVNHRGLWKKKKDAKAWDRTLVPVYGLLAFYVLPIVMGLDVGRYQWSSLGPVTAAFGTALYLLGSAILTWAMLVNTHFESTVRIQHDRGHKVVTTGPYAFVRHPGYIGISLWALSTPLIVGSVAGLVSAGLAVAVLVFRTWLEDKTLHRELPGYATYAAGVRYRLVPGLW